MTSTSSLMAAAPFFCSPSAKPRDSAARPGVLLARPLPNPRRSRPLGQRWMHGGARVKPQANTRLFYSWKQHNHRIDGKGALGFPTEQLGSPACFHSHQCCRGHTRRQATGMFQNKSTFSIRRHPFWSSTGNSVLTPYATLGPDEPHVAGTAWSETALEKQGSGFWSSEAEKVELERILNSPLPPHPKLHRGQLKNGLRYIILPNKIPADRFEAHMEVHVGSIDEEDDEQGIAHMIEHVAFLGSKKREKLLGTGARSNAYTDFHHTVFHIHSPSTTKASDEDLLPAVLDALSEIAFHPKFLASRVEKERRAILSELQMMNTIEYRVDCQLLQHLHSENKLSTRFPIGLEEQIKKWDADKIRKFHERWYFPANATLYLVGDIDNIPKAVQHIETVFERTLEENEVPTVQSPSAFGAMASFLVPKLPGGLVGSLSGDRSSNSSDPQKPTKKEKHAVRPPIEHNWSLPGFGDSAKLPEVFQHELIQNFSINMFCKIPVNQVRTYGDLRNVLMKRIFLSALQFRINSRYKSSNPPFQSIEMDHSDSGREGCTVTTLTVTAEARNWRDAIKVAVHEVRRLKEFGVTKGELARYMDALIKDSEQLATMIDSVPSVDNLDFIMESDALGHIVMDQRQAHESLVAIAETVTLEEVNSIGAEVLEFISDYGKPSAPIPAAIVACIPKKVHTDGVGESEFNIYPHEIVNAMKEGLDEPIHAEPELEVPKELITSSELEALRLQRKPFFVSPQEGNTTKLFDKETGITQIRLSNGIPVNYKISKTEPRSGVMRLIVGGGRSTETSESKGAVVVGVRTLSEGGCVGSFSREQVELFCVNHLVNCSLESNEEFICMEFRFSLRDDGMRAAFQLLHMVLEHSVWLEEAFERAKQLYLSYYRSIPKSLERSTAHKIMLAMLNGDERFVEPTPQSLQNLTLHSVKEAVMNQFVGDNMEVSIVGDFAEDDLESCILDYLGTVRNTRTAKTVQSLDPIMFRPSPSDLQSQQVYLKDTDERACAYIAGPAPNRWGFTVEGKDLFDLIKSSTVNDEQFNSEKLLHLESKDVKDNLKNYIRQHPLFFGVTLGLLAEIINSRLFTTVRDSLGLTYDVSFELSLFDRLKLGWYVISVTSTPSKVHKAVDACKNVLQGLHNTKIAQRELDRAKRTLMMKHEAESKTNAYWLGLLAHLQSSSTLRKDISCIKGLNALYEAATIEDIYVAYEHLKVDDNSLFSCIGVAGAQSSGDALGAVDEVADIGQQGFAPSGRGLSTMTRPTT